MNPVSFLGLADIACILLYFLACIPLALCFRQKRYRHLPLPCLPLLLCYFFHQGAVMLLWDDSQIPARIVYTDWFRSLPPAVLRLFLLFILVWIGLLLALFIRHERSSVTPMSVKAAVDSLPAGVCVYLPGGRPVLLNWAMERFCSLAAGERLVNGEAFRDRIREGTLLPGCGRFLADGVPVIILPEGTAWAMQEAAITYDGLPVTRLLVSNVTEIYRKTEALRKSQASLEALNARLTAYNREIVALTAEKELLDARVRLHDQMGQDLLTMKRYLAQGGTAQDQQEIEAMLRRNLSFLKTGQRGDDQDEYTLMLETAEKLGVRVSITGTLPETQPQKHIIATAIHECFTNTLRHAHGDRLTVEAADLGDTLQVTFTNNGQQPTGPIEEKGGLASLRQLTQRACGSMAVSTEPVFSIVLTLPKEVLPWLSEF